MLTERDLAERIGVILSDGTPLRDLIDIERRSVSLRVLSDPEIFELEMKKLFARGWVIVGHECEIPNEGDYVVRSIANDKVIVTRAEDGSVNVLLNVCTHRAMEVCRVDRGNASTFTCPYHGYAFDSKGSLLGAPFEKEMYGADGDKSGFGLVRARVDTVAGVIFASYGDENDPDLDEYLGDFKFYIDWNLGGTNWEVAGPVQRFRMSANWKVLSDQLAGDGYHAAHLHRSLVETNLNRPELGLGGSEFGYHTNFSFENGHCSLSWDNRFIFGGRKPEPDDPFGVQRTFPMQVFPCSTIGGSGRNEDGTHSMASIGSLIPRTPDVFELWSVQLVNTEAPELTKSMAGGGTLGSAVGGLIFADDAQQGPSTQRASHGTIARERVPMMYNATHGGTNKPENWDGPGLVYDGFPKDDNQWNWWNHWFDVMTKD
jgi:phenylpropionate dioxygenase-like ring-hydroxylating dioxygenase large terminal subunit